MDDARCDVSAVYEDTLNGCPSRSTNTASINDATSISTANPRAYRPGPLTPLDANAASSQPLNSTFDPWSDPLTLSSHPVLATRHVCTSIAPVIVQSSGCSGTPQCSVFSDTV